MNSAHFFLVHQSLKMMKTRWSIQQGFQFNKTLGLNMKNGTMMIPFNYYSRNDTCLQDFIVDWIYQFISPIQQILSPANRAAIRALCLMNSHASELLVAR